MTSIELNAKATNQGSTSWRDLIGIVASIGCAIHCAAMPFVIAYLPAWGLSFLADEAFHKWMALACFLIALAAFLPGLRKHGSWLPVGVGSIGLTLITFAAFGLAGECCPSCDLAAGEATAGATDLDSCESGCAHCDHCSEPPADDQTTTVALVTDTEPSKDRDWLSLLAPWLTPLGGMLLVSAHLMNRRYGCLCGCCGPETDKLPVSSS